MEIILEFVLAIGMAIVGAMCAMVAVAVLRGLRATVGAITTPHTIGSNSGPWVLSVFRTGVPVRGPLTTRLLAIDTTGFSADAFIDRFDEGAGCVGPLLLVGAVIGLVLAAVEVAVLSVLLLLVLAGRLLLSRWKVRVIDPDGVETTREFRGIRTALRQARGLRSALESDGTLPLEWRLPG